MALTNALLWLIFLGARLSPALCLAGGQGQIQWQGPVQLGRIVRRTPMEEQPDQRGAETSGSRHVSMPPDVGKTARVAMTAEAEAHAYRKQQLHFAEHGPKLSPQHQETVQLLKKLERKYWKLLNLHQSRLERNPHARPGFARRRFQRTDDERESDPKDQEHHKPVEEVINKSTKEHVPPLRSSSDLRRQSRRVLGPDFPPQDSDEARPLAR